MPVPTVAGETRRVEAQDGAHLTGAEARDKPLKAGARHGSAGRSAEVVVNDLDVAKTPAAGLLDKIVLATLALPMDLHLGLCGLPHIDDRLAAQDRCRQGISVRHRRSPWDPRPRLPSTSGPDAARRCCDRLLPARSTLGNSAPSRIAGAACRGRPEAAVVA